MNFAYLRFALFLTLTTAVSTISAQDPGGQTKQEPRQVNVTSDSARGWIPSVELEKIAQRTATAYLDAKDHSRYTEAYALLSDNNKPDSLDAFSDQVREFNVLAGAVIERRLTMLTWTKDPANAPVPGIYAALDQVGSFANIDRYCGYLMLYQPPAGGEFRVMREEQAYLDNGKAQEIASRESMAGVDKAWKGLSAHCPNYPRGMPSAPQASKAPLQEAPADSIDYPTVAAALEDLRSRPGMEVNVQNGWMIISDRAAKALWSFAPPGHPAYPAAVKRQAVDAAQGASLEMNVLCEASKQACDDLVREFQQLNAKAIRKPGG